jgi:DNA invertase Pin-like site-specific DNA recombinase
MTQTARSAVAYYRVSTPRQGQSGLGIEAQQVDVQRLAAQHGFTITQEFTETESGRKKNRPRLEAALQLARQTNAVLLIAKIDRLARNVAFTSALMESGVDFQAADMPEADRCMVHIMAALAEREAKLISDRTRAALIAAKARGTRLGTVANLTAEARAKGPKASREAAKIAMQQPTAFASSLRAQGGTLEAIARTLNESGFRTRQGGMFSAVQVKRMIDRVEKLV